MVRTAPFHGANRGSIPLGATDQNANKHFEEVSVRVSPHGESNGKGLPTGRQGSGNRGFPVAELTNRWVRGSELLYSDSRRSLPLGATLENHPELVEG